MVHDLFSRSCTRRTASAFWRLGGIACSRNCPPSARANDQAAQRGGQLKIGQPGRPVGLRADHRTGHQHALISNLLDTLVLFR